MKDALSDIFDSVRLRATLYFRTDFSPPWAIKVPDLAPAARFHFVLQGQCSITLSDGRSVELGADDLAIIPRGAAHILADRPGRDGAPLEQVIGQSGFDGKGAFVLNSGDPLAATQIVCGHFGFTRGADHPLLRALPDIIELKSADRAAHPMLDETLRLLVRRVFADSLGAAAAVARLSEVFFIEAIRAARSANPELARMFNGMTDPHIGRALELIHAHPGENWSVESLAAKIGMSRSRFAEQFNALLAEGPMGYLQAWRLQLALTHLNESRATVQEVAAKVGYRSAAAFSRAFRDKFGASPSDIRRAGFL